MTNFRFSPGTLVRVVHSVREENVKAHGVGMVLSAQLSPHDNYVVYRVLYEDGNVITKRTYCLYELK